MDTPFLEFKLKPKPGEAAKRRDPTPTTGIIAALHEHIPTRSTPKISLS
ncbi:hypothetical protein [Paeniglutamicibacter psychrophenolicus]|uniref:Uncharacterized protein n=1 Tax=Paeniglutamicibacter psychrophenolicus TaxID=257454 RepID=A0ABS4WJK9_9MICC|nr:hypothetical protein [Paeniglutamicibacter psychrophenolicus]MBP2376148.1 hypothetical protein [Paeniglutamicibacter psychrophenolicus]